MSKVATNDFLSIYEAAEVYKIEADKVVTVIENHGSALSFTDFASFIGMSRQTVYEAAKAGKFPNALVLSLSGKPVQIKLLHKELAAWYKVYWNRKAMKGTKHVCGLYEFGDCDEEVPNTKKFCSREHYAAYNKHTNRFEYLGSLGHEGKGVGKRENSPEARSKRSMAALRSKKNP